jgi:hypothetical protein
VLYSLLSIYGPVTMPVIDQATPTVDPDAYRASNGLAN